MKVYKIKNVTTEVLTLEAESPEHALELAAEYGSYEWNTGTEQTVVCVNKRRAHVARIDTTYNNGKE